jgi:hypothetical protein
MKRTILVALVSFVAAFVVGCNRPDPAASKREPSTNTSTSPQATYLLAKEPASAQGVIEVKQAAKDGQDVVVVGRIGGSEKPFTGRAAFTIVDVKLKPCSEEESCPTPWDYCCLAPDELAKGTVLVKFVDEAGKTLPDDAKTLLGVKELQTVVVKGQTRRDESNSLSVVASGLFVRNK